MGFRNLTFKAFKIDPPKLEGFSSYIQPSEGWQNSVFTCLTTGFPTSVGRNMASGGCLLKKKKKKKETTSQSFAFNLKKKNKKLPLLRCVLSFLTYFSFKLSAVSLYFPYCSKQCNQRNKNQDPHLPQTLKMVKEKELQHRK